MVVCTQKHTNLEMQQTQGLISEVMAPEFPQAAHSRGTVGRQHVSSNSESAAAEQPQREEKLQLFSRQRRNKSTTLGDKGWKLVSNSLSCCQA